jgi:DNA mismatch repair protein MSH5
VLHGRRLIAVAVLEHARPDVILTSWKADDTFIDALRGYGTPMLHICTLLASQSFVDDDIADANDATISVRLAREFAASRGRDRLFSLELFSNVSLPNVDSVDLQADDGASSLSDASGLRDAYSFMHHRRESTGVRDPSLVQWRSRIRLGSYATVDAAPLCVSVIVTLSISKLTLISAVHR